MIEDLYEKNLQANLIQIQNMSFGEILQFCRDLYGLKQYACSDYLGMHLPRYKKFELGLFSEPIEAWEMKRLEVFFKLPPGLLRVKQKEYLTERAGERKDVCAKVWGTIDETAGERNNRDGEFTRVKGEL